ncbi:hypothetical protein MUO71_07400 [Candidatus Bathyarchaeota archaeon]|nr:hypothetical protein [Candidatus Bathyarchaeota archaeon]
MNNVVVQVEVTVNPTEDMEKVKKAAENIFGALEFKVELGKRGRLLIAETRGDETVIKLHDHLSREQILAAARKVFRSGMTEKAVTFYLNKQVAYAGHISFSQQTAESPLGPISVQIRCDNPRKLIDWLAPRPPPKTRKNASRQ